MCLLEVKSPTSSLTHILLALKDYVQSLTDQYESGMKCSRENSNTVWAYLKTLIETYWLYSTKLSKFTWWYHVDVAVVFSWDSAGF